MSIISRREFLRRGAAALASLALPSVSRLHGWPTLEEEPASLGRITTWWAQAVRAEPAPTADLVGWRTRDEVIPIHAAVSGVPPWPSNRVWYRTDEGYIHSGYVQPVADSPQQKVRTKIVRPGSWAQVCVPYVDARWQPGGVSVARRLYYSTLYRVVRSVTDEAGTWWYQLQEGISYSPGPYVLASALRLVPVSELVPLSPGRADKLIQIDIDRQLLTCFEGKVAVFTTLISSGVGDTFTPYGEHHVVAKRHTSRMIGGEDEEVYDLPGVPFPVYFTSSGVAIHGTYWHNDYGRPHSHGCVNVTTDAARWIFCWSEPSVPYDESSLSVERGAGTRIVVG